MISGVIYTALRGLVNDNVYASDIPQEEERPTWPRIRYRLSGNNEPTICGTGTTDTDDTRALIDVITMTNGATEALRDQVIDALQNTDPPCYRDGEYVMFKDPITKTHRCILQYQFFASSP